MEPTRRVCPLVSKNTNRFKEGEMVLVHCKPDRPLEDWDPEGNGYIGHQGEITEIEETPGEDGERLSNFAAGRRFVGQELVRQIKLKVGQMKEQDNG